MITLRFETVEGNKIIIVLPVKQIDISSMTTRRLDARYTLQLR